MFFDRRNGFHSYVASNHGLAMFHYDRSIRREGFEWKGSPHRDLEMIDNWDPKWCPLERCSFASK